MSIVERKFESAMPQWIFVLDYNFFSLLLVYTDGLLGLLKFLSRQRKQASEQAMPVRRAPKPHLYGSSRPYSSLRKT